MEFVLKGFRQEKNTRHYSFQGVGSDRKRTDFLVCVDLILARKYAIPMQELPLLCRQLLVDLPQGVSQSLSYTEKDMLGYANRRAVAAQDAAAKRQKAHRRHPSPRIGQAWRTQGAGSQT